MYWVDLSTIAILWSRWVLVTCAIINVNKSEKCNFAEDGELRYLPTIMIDSQINGMTYFAGLEIWFQSSTEKFEINKNK